MVPKKCGEKSPVETHGFLVFNISMAGYGIDIKGRS
jgi:hypothetical protein